MLKGVLKKYPTGSFRFLEKNFGANITQNNKKLKMTLLDVIDFDKI